MAFMIHSTDDGRAPGVEYLPCGEITPEVGLALVQADGLLEVAAGAVAPAYICLCKKDAACAEGDIIPVVRVQKDMVFETFFSESAAAISLGDKVTLEATGDSVTATTTSGVAEVVYMDGTAEGSICRVRF